MTVGLCHPTQRTHIQLTISSEVSVVDIDISPVMVGILGKKITFQEKYGQIQQGRWQVPLCVSHSSSRIRTECQEGM